ncbi:MAG: uracil-DNA glycosylase [Methylococcus sp.]|nr:MAG: uracil-DNA glycosylase [Methylococcus sp.]
MRTLGIETWTPRLQPPLGPPRSEVEVPLSTDEGSTVSVLEKPRCENWDELEQEVRTCTRCALHETRTQVVFGVGNRNASWLFIGEAPGEQEDLQGEPFVGRAGQLLNEMIKALGLAREDVYIANVLKCRPPQNRDPSPSEVASCESYLQSQVALIKPDIIMAVGRIAAQNLLKTTTPIGKLRGQVHDYQGIPLVVTYHPAYLLRSQTEKRRAWEDLKLARRTLTVQATPGIDSSQ